MDLQVFVALV